jgi:hypothetical protein
MGLMAISYIKDAMMDDEPAVCVCLLWLGGVCI